ncbi:uncharacterized protein LOC129569898 [Sitodiplosis mosellana]|uniref:uncharacterized protein LOC129569898 n=1 Tax=Sitodiplosis mosellana TaxID=263140 RepID=UPI002444A3C1|nr:uncharacterized protein LOC129569898 [Sitodiplosis mosellana]
MDLSNLTSVLFNDEVNDTQVRYHLVYPKHFNLIKKSKIASRSGSGQSVSNKRRRRGRPRKEDVKKSEEDRRAAEENANDEKPDENVVVQFKSTRYGRVSRPPKHMSNSTFVDIKDTRIASTTTDTTIPMDTMEIQNSVNVEQQPDAGGKTTKIVVEAKKVRKNVDRFTCAVCKKVYLGRKKMLKHYLAFPEHKIPPIQNNKTHTNGHIVNSFLFDELMKAVGSASQTERISMFLAEISNFVSRVRLFKPKILHPEQASTEYYVDKNVSKILDLPEGLLQLNDRAFDDNLQQNNNTFSTYIEETNGPSDQISSLSNLQQQLGYNLNLFPQVNYDQISDNAVEAEVLGKSNEAITDLSHETPILDIPLDLFSFNNLK